MISIKRNFNYIKIFNVLSAHLDLFSVMPLNFSLIYMLLLFMLLLLENENSRFTQFLVLNILNVYPRICEQLNYDLSVVGK